MKNPRSVYILILVFGLAGGALFITLLVRHNIRDIAATVGAAGWGVVAVVLFHLVPMFFDVLGWWALIPPANRLPFSKLFLMRWIGDSVSALLPVAQVGGEVVRVRLASTAGMPVSIAASSVLVGMTVSVVTQLIFTISGFGLLIALSGKSGMVGSAVVGLVIAVLAVAGFYAIQRFGMFRLMGTIIAHLMRSDAWKGLVEKGEELDQDVRALYARRKELLMSGVWTMVNWATGAVEVWIALRALGVHAGYGQAYVMESMSQGIRSVMFIVPGALGVQEGGYLVVGTALGIGPETALAVAMIRRVRELAIGIPALFVWQWIEGRRFWTRRLQPAPREVPSSTPAK
jgi:putative membrane protein